MRLKYTINEIKNDLPKGRFSIRLFIANFLYSPRFRVLLNHRLGKYFNSSRIKLFKLLGSHYKARLITKRHCDISYNAILGKHLRFPHPIGIVIGDNVVIKDDVIIFQQVTLGSHGRKGEEKRYPVIESGVKIYSGAKIIGGVTIGENAIIGANAVVNIDVPSGAIAVGIPCKILNK